MIIDSPVTHAAFRPERMGKTDLAAGRHLFSGLNAFEPGQRHAAHVHPDQDKLYVVLEGVAGLTVGAETRRAERGAVALAAAGVEHAIENPGPGRLVVLVVMSPPPAAA